MEGDLDLQRFFKLVPIPKKKTPSKKTIVMKNKNEKGEKVEKNWVDDETLHRIVIRGEMELEFAKKNVKKHKIFFLKKEEKNHEKRKKKKQKRPKVNLILSYIDHTFFLYWTPSL